MPTIYLSIYPNNQLLLSILNWIMIILYDLSFCVCVCLCVYLYERIKLARKILGNWMCFLVKSIVTKKNTHTHRYMTPTHRHTVSNIEWKFWNFFVLFCFLIFIFQYFFCCSNANHNILINFISLFLFFFQNFLPWIFINQYTIYQPTIQPNQSMKWKIKTWTWKKSCQKNQKKKYQKYFWTNQKIAPYNPLHTEQKPTKITLF